MKKLVPILLGRAFLALPLGYFLPSEKVVTYCICGCGLLAIFTCTIYGIITKDEFNRLTESMLFVSASICAIVLSPLVLLLVVLAYIALAIRVMTYNTRVIYHFFMPWILGVSFLSLPIVIAVSSYWWIAVLICVIAIAIIAVVGTQYIRLLILYWDQKSKERYITYSISIFSMFLGTTLFATIYNDFISLVFWWLSLIIMLFGGMITTCILLVIALLVIHIINIINRFRKK